MELLRTHLDAVRVIKPRIFADTRGHFFEAYHMETMRGLGIDVPFVQDNQSYSRRGVLRGLHYQIGRPQAKLVRVLHGRIFDVAVDIRPGSPTFGQWCGEFLSDVDGLQMYVPAGFAHGFLAISEVADVLYKCSDFYAPEEERGIAWNDPSIGIAWPLEGRTPHLAPKDAALPKLADAQINRLSWCEVDFPCSLVPVTDVSITIPEDGAYHIHVRGGVSKVFNLKIGDTVKAINTELFINGEIHE